MTVTRDQAAYPNSTTAGAAPEIKDVLVKVRGGNKAAGALVMLDLQASDPDTQTDWLTNPDAGFGTAVAPSAGAVAGTDPARFGVMLQAVLDDATGMCRLRGPVSALILRAAGDVTFGDELTANTNGYLKGNPGDGARVLAIAKESVSAPSSATLAAVWFDGELGFGSEGSSAFATKAYADAAVAAEATARDAAIAAVLDPIYGDGAEGAGSFAADTTLSANRYFTTCSVAAGKKVTTAGWGIFCTGTLTLDAGATIRNNGAAAAGDTHGSGAVGNFYPGGADGGDGKALAGDDGIASHAVVGGTDGGGGGSQGLNAGGSGSALTAEQFADPRKIAFASYSTENVFGLSVAASGGGGGGGGDAVHLGGGGGGGGGMLVVAAPTIVIGAGAGFEAKGGLGADGVDPDSGGGGGGGGGIVAIITRSDRATVEAACNTDGGGGGQAAGTGGGGGTGQGGQTIILKA